MPEEEGKFDTALLAELPFFMTDLIEDPYGETAPSSFSNYLDAIKKSKKNHEFVLLHLNINSIYHKFYEIDAILDTRAVDILRINETKLDSSVPSSIYQHPRY